MTGDPVPIASPAEHVVQKLEAERLATTRSLTRNQQLERDLQQLIAVLAHALLGDKAPQAGAR